MADLLIVNGVVVTVDPDRRVLEDGAVAIAGDVGDPATPQMKAVAESVARQARRAAAELTGLGAPAQALAERGDATARRGRGLPDGGGARPRQDRRDVTRVAPPQPDAGG